MYNTITCDNQHISFSAASGGVRTNIEVENHTPENIRSGRYLPQHVHIEAATNAHTHTP